MKKEKIRYFYKGPLYRFEHVFRGEWEGYTEAVSEKQAINNLNKKAKDEFGFKPDVKLNIDPKYLEVSIKHPNDDDFKNAHTLITCPDCGTQYYDDEQEECPECGRKLEESNMREKEELYYDNLKVTLAGKHHDATWDDQGGDPEYWDEIETEIEWVYKVDKNDVEDALFEIILEKDPHAFDTMENEEIDNYLRDNYDDLFESHYKELLSYFEDKAIEDAEENYVEDPFNESLEEDINNMKEKIKEILDKYNSEKTSKISLFEVDPDKMWIEHFDDGDIDFSKFAEHTQSDNNSKYYSFMITGGLNGSGKWEDYLEDISDIFKEFEEKLNLKPVLYKVEADVSDDVWTGKIFLYEKPTNEQLKESLLYEELKEEIEAGDCAYHPERDEYFYLKKTNKSNTFELYTYSDSRGFEVASPRFIDKNSPFYNKLQLHAKNANSHFKENLEEDIDELIYKVAEKLKNNINSFEDELITLSQIEGVDVEEIKQREPMQIAKALVEEGIVDSRMFEDIEKHDTLKESNNCKIIKYKDGKQVDELDFDKEQEASKWTNACAEVNSNKIDYFLFKQEKDKIQGKVYKKDGKVISDKSTWTNWNEWTLDEDIEKHDTLNPKLFDGEELKPEVKEAIQNIADTFIKELHEDGIKFNLKDIVLVGSNVSYNYTKDSDLDIHIIADSKGLECPDDLYPLLYSAYRSIFNKNYDISIKGIPAEIYVELDQPAGISNGIYSLNNGWIKKPEPKAIPELNKEEFDKLFREWEEKYNQLLNRINEDLSDDIYDFIEDLYDLRKESIAKEGEYGLGNLVFKEFRNRGYLDNLKELRKQEKGKELSLEKLDNSLGEAKLNESDSYIIKEYRKYAGIDESIQITEDNINNYALNRVSAYENYDIEELKELLLNRGIAEWASH